MAAAGASPATRPKPAASEQPRDAATIAAHRPEVPSYSGDDAAAATDLLLGRLAAVAVREHGAPLRPADALAGPLDDAAPWARALPPAAQRRFADETAAAVRLRPPGQGPAVAAVLGHWHDVAARFAS
ncbi:MAG: hypothetical protein M9891_11270 [Austwickia sp.]|nr:hypothetical protein [Austwickia sp.]